MKYSVTLLLLLCFTGTFCLDKGLYQKDKPVKGDTNEDLDNEDETSLFGSASASSSVGGRESSRSVFSNLFSNIFGRKHSLLGSLENDNEQSFMGGFTSFMRPWWKGENVCSREEETDSDLSGEVQGSALMNTLMTSCRDMGDVYICTMTSARDGQLKKKTLIYECCQGWERVEGRRGCTQSVDLKNLEETLQYNNFTRFVEVAAEVGLEETLRSGNLTVFVPSDEALNTASQSDEIDMVVANSADPMQFARDILKGHMVEGWYKQYSLSDEQSLQTLDDGAQLRINYYNSPVPFMTANCARVTSTDHMASNGIIHTVDKVIIPSRQTLWQMLGQDPRFSTFSSLISSEMQERLSNSSAHLTVLAFTDDDFAKQPQEMQDRITNKEACFASIVEEHVLPYTICSAAIYREAYVRTLANHRLNATRENIQEGRVMFEGVPVIVADKMATNGVIHIVNGPVLQRNMMTTLNVLEKMEHPLVDLLRENQLLDAVQKNGPATIFVPSVSSINKIAEDDVDSEDLKQFLLNHVVEGEIIIDGTMDNMQLETEASDGQLTLTLQRTPFSFFRPQVFAGCSKVLRANVKTCNGVIHFVDKIMPVADQSLMSLLRETEDISEFVTLIEMAEMEGEIDDDLKGTILAPTNDALKLLDDQFKEGLLSDPQNKLAPFLRRHILNDKLCCNMMGFGGILGSYSSLKTISGDSLRVGRGLGLNPSIGGADIIDCDLLATNGIVHTINRPIVRTRRVSSIFDRRSSMFDRVSDRNWPF